MRKEGKGKLPNRARSLSDADVEELWKSKQFGCSSPRSLIQTVWWNNCLHFGMRSREEHYHIIVEDFQFNTDNAGKNYVSFEEGLTKNRNGGLNFKPRKIFPRMYETGGERCPVAFLRQYIQHRPNSVRSAGPFYLGIIDLPISDIWYKTIRMGVNTIDITSFSYAPTTAHRHRLPRWRRGRNGESKFQAQAQMEKEQWKLQRLYKEKPELS